MSDEKNTTIKELGGRLLRKPVSDISCIAAFLYTPIDLLVRGCDTLRQRLLYRHNEEALYERSQFKMLFRKIISGSDIIVKDRLLLGTALISTLVLQLISFSTTKDGVTYYFSSISPYAPLAFAFTIQFLFYILSNFGSGRFKFNIPRKLMLLSVFLISMLFSYIGIINDYVPPFKTFEKNYNAFYDAYSDAYSQVTGTFKQELSTPMDQIQLLFDNASRLCAQADSEIAANDAQISALSEINETVRTGYNQWGYRIYDINPAYEEAQREIRSYENKNNTLKSGRDILSGYREILASDAHLSSELDSYMEEKIPTPQFSRLNNDFIQMTAAYNQLLASLESQTFEPVQTDLIQLAGQYTTDREVLSLKLMSFEEIMKAAGISASSDNESLYKLSNGIEQELKDKYGRFLIAARAALPNFDSALLETRYAELIPLPDVNLLALKKLSPSSEYFEQGLVALFLALLVDGMTVLIPFFIKSRKSSILVVSRFRKARYSEEEVLEKILLSISSAMTTEPKETNLNIHTDLEAAATAELCRNPKNDPFTPALMDSRRRLSDCIQLLAGYFTLFGSSPWTNSSGYSKYLSERNLNKQGCAVYNHLTDILCSLQYLTVISEYEYQILVSEAQNSLSPLPYEGNKKGQGDTIYLMKKNFDLWLSENLAGLLQLENMR